MLTRGKVLQSHDFSIEHEPGMYNVIPDALTRLFYFEEKNVPRNLSKRI